MTPETLIVLGVLVAAVVLFLTEWLAVDLVAVLVLLTLALTGVIGHSEALSGFSNDAVITVAAVLVLSAGLMRAGVADIVGRQIMRLAGRSERRLLVLTMLITGLLSGIMNNIGIAALLLPVVLDVSRRLDRSPSKLLMPLAFASLLGGMTTLIGTAPNILISGALTAGGQPGFGLLDFTPIGLTALAAGTLYMVFLGQRLLPDRDLARESPTPQRDLPGTYGLSQRFCAMVLPDPSQLDGKSLADSRLGSALGLNVVAITRDGQTSLAPGPDAILRSGDKLLVEGRLDQLNAMRGWKHLVLEGDRWTGERLGEIGMDMAELEVGSETDLVGKTLLETRFRRRFGVNVLAIQIADDVHIEGLTALPLAASCRLLVQAPAAKLARLEGREEFSAWRRIDPASAVERYGIQERILAVRVPEDSLLVGKMLAESRLGDAFGLTVLGMLREGETRLTQALGEEFEGGDTLLVQGRTRDLHTVQGLQELQVRESGPAVTAGADEDLGIEDEEVKLVEVVLSHGSRLAGQTLRELRFREKHGLSVLAILSEGHAHRSNLRDRAVGFGDVMLVHGPQEKIELLKEDSDFLVLTALDQEAVDPGKAPVAAAIMVAVIAAVVSGLLPIVVAAPAGAALMVITGCLTMPEVYQRIEWKAVVLIAGMLSLGVAMQQTGTASMLAGTLVETVGAFGPRAVTAAMFWFTALAAQVMPTAAVAVLLSPIALDTAAELGMQPHSLLMVVALATSSAFMSPLGHPVNLMVMGLGGYRFADYSKVGLPLVIVVFLVAMLVVPLVFPLMP